MKGWIGDLKALVGADGVSNAPRHRASAARDLWPLVTLRALGGERPAEPEAVCWPRSAEEVSAVLRWARRAGVPIVPYGGGSGVCGGTLPVRGGVVLDLKRMDRLVEVSDTGLWARAQAGMMGERFERALNERGLTAGHFPSSIACSTVGGWVAARSAGQLSTLYGKIEDLTLALEAVLPDGTLYRSKITPRSAAGPDLMRLFLGSEGTLGVITEATLRLRPLPPSRRFRAFSFREVAEGTEAIRRILRTGARPAAVRLYDKLDTALIGKGGAQPKGAEATGAGRRRLPPGRAWRGRPPSLTAPMLREALRRFTAHPWLARGAERALPDCLLVLTFEGEARLTAAEEEIALEAAAAEGGSDLGPGPAERWWRDRYLVSYGMSRVFDAGAFVDTIEVATTWERLLPLYRRVREAVSAHAVVMAHFSHAYAEGSSIYFTFTGWAKTAGEKERIYRETWKGAMEAALAVGATITHHHGVGLLKAPWMEAEWGPGGVLLYRTIQKALDPAGVMNPGKILPDPEGR